MMKKRWISLTAAALAMTAVLAACADSPATAEPGYVGLDAAKETALNDLQLSAADASFTTAELADRNGTAYYELDFTDGTTTYHYAVDAVTGAIIESGTDTAAASATSGPVDEAGAQALALADAGITETDTVYLRVQPDYDDGRLVYDVEFFADSTEYDYEIDAATGTILSKDYDAEGYHPTSGGSTTASGTTGGTVDEAGAQAIALADAGVTAADTSYLQVRADYDDGRLVYDVEFYVPSTGIEYDYEIDGTTGAIRDMDSDAEGYTPAQTGSAKSEDEIRAIALAKVPGATASDLRMQLDYDDGRQYYEGSIYYDGLEYEFEIDAYSGAVLSWEVDSIYD